jgi:hypothetical protein
MINFNYVCYCLFIDYLEENNIEYSIENYLFYSALIIPNNNYKIYNYYISNYYMVYKDDKYIFKIHGLNLSTKKINEILKYKND